MIISTAIASAKPMGRHPTTFHCLLYCVLHHPAPRTEKGNYKIRSRSSSRRNKKKGGKNQWRSGNENLPRTSSSPPPPPHSPCFNREMVPVNVNVNWQLHRPSLHSGHLFFCLTGALISCRFDKFQFHIPCGQLPSGGGGGGGGQSHQNPNSTRQFESISLFQEIMRLEHDQRHSQP